MIEPLETVVNRRIRLLKEQSDMLAKLLAEPQPGIMAWMVMVGEACTEIEEIMHGRRDA